MVEAAVTYKGRILNPLSYTELEDIPDGALTVKEGKIISMEHSRNIQNRM
jgi:hypothetical protein